MATYSVDTGFKGEGYSRRLIKVEAASEAEARVKAVAVYIRGVDTRSVEVVEESGLTRA